LSRPPVESGIETPLPGTPVPVCPQTYSARLYVRGAARSANLWPDRTTTAPRDLATTASRDLAMTGTPLNGRSGERPRDLQLSPDPGTGVPRDFQQHSQSWGALLGNRAGLPTPRKKKPRRFGAYEALFRRVEGRTDQSFAGTAPTIGLINSLSRQSRLFKTLGAIDWGPTHCKWTASVGAVYPAKSCIVAALRSFLSAFRKQLARWRNDGALENPYSSGASLARLQTRAGRGCPRDL
jgi:hypothetical protein